MKKPEIDLTNCVLCEICTDYCPSVFRLNVAGFVEVMELEEYPEADINEVIKNCRGDCLFWVENEYCINAG
ncbi:MAG: ferredoxin [Deltaproteobacteria bacterium]|nr:ferredoxin [Deltaproteobacteria bacterium]